MKKLQLTLKDFRKLCILKGVYPREPKRRKAAQHGKGGIQTLYAKKDILFLGADPMIWDMRKLKPHFKKMAKAKGRRDFRELRALARRHPKIDIDHVIKERYPSFIDAMKDLDDCLSLLFLFAQFPSIPGVPHKFPHEAQKLITQFLLLVIEARALRRVFVSIKGYYFQVELRGQLVTWIVPHQFGFVPTVKRNVDFKVMSHFVELYITLLGFVNFRLYQQHNLIYPPRLSNFTYGGNTRKGTEAKGTEYQALPDRIASLNEPLRKSRFTVPEEEQPLDSFLLSDNPDEAARMQKELERTNKLKTLFNGLKIFVNREVPREPVVLCIRALGGEVSWDKVLFAGATFNEDDETITHQIVDRPSMDKQYISRYYVQPQWVFDSVNAAQLLPVERYLLGVVLPPHLSPFFDPTRDQRYKPPEELEIFGSQSEEGSQGAKVAEKKASEDEESSEEDEEENEDEDEKDSEEESEEEAEEPKEDDIDEDLPEEEKQRLAKKKKMAVKKGTIAKEEPVKPELEAREDEYLRSRLVRNKHKRLFNSMMEGRKKRMKEVKLLTNKRAQLEAEAAAAKKEEKRQRKKAAAVLQA